MALEPKEWVKAHHRSNKNVSSGVFVYIDSETLRFSNIPTDKPLLVKRYPTSEGKIILKFKVQDKVKE